MLVRHTEVPCKGGTRLLEKFVLVVLQAGVTGRICCCGTGIPSVSRMMELQNGRDQITVFKYQRKVDAITSIRSKARRTIRKT